MVIDTSALLAIFLREADARPLVAAIVATPIRLISAVSFLEGAIVAEARKGPAARAEFALFVQEIEGDVVPFDVEQAKLARDAYRVFGKGVHAARLNFGDCCVYALAKSSSEPVLFVGNDFARTDLAVVDLHG